MCNSNRRSRRRSTHGRPSSGRTARPSPPESRNQATAHAAARAGEGAVLRTARHRYEPRAQRPFGTTILGDLGARIIKIESPGHGDDTRTFGPFYKRQSLYFSFVNRGKESIVLNLKQDDDRAVFLNVVRQADVLTENFRPGAMDRLGFSYEALSKIKPRLIHASATGFGQTGRSGRSHRPFHGFADP
jgi:hypothetical protein